MIDSDFVIERPKRVYRTGFQLATGHGNMNFLTHKAKTGSDEEVADENDIDTDNPLATEMIVASGEGEGDKATNMHDEGESKASQHTFFIANSQRRLKLVARNAVSCSIWRWMQLIRIR